jgi:1-acyl-sn-glycerol-3-phosphate acyltransferase
MTTGERMRKTIFYNPVLSRVMHHLAKSLLRVLGWTYVGAKEKPPKYVVIAAPHTSNWDFFYTMLVAFALDIKVFAMGKKSLTEGPLGKLMLWLGVIPIDRDKSNNVVVQTIDTFNKHDNLVVIIPPSGTRNKVKYWKTGFYHIAHGAGVPIALGFIDYKKKQGGLGPFIKTSGDIDKDMKVIRAFYANVTGKYPENQMDR